jgi:hypothetical protein
MVEENDRSDQFKAVLSRGKSESSGGNKLSSKAAIGQALLILLPLIILALVNMSTKGEKA